MIKQLLACAFVVGMSATVAAQNITIKRVELAGDKFIVHYDLDDSNPNNEYKLDLYSSKDNFTAPLIKVKGDVGAEVKPGLDRKIEWSIREEFGAYKGIISLEIRGKVYVPFVKLQNFDADGSYKRGKSFSLAWKPGNSNPINVELYKGGQRIDGDMNQPNSGGHTFYIPTQAKPGSDYRLKFTDTKNPSDVVYTENFKVKPKIPLLVKLLPVAIIGGVVVAMSGGGGNPDPGPTDVNELPAAPGAPNN